MTIAACYVSPEGVVLGADSTSTYTFGTGVHYFNHGQKLFEVGEGARLGIVTWGLGGLNVSSHRRLFALLADDLESNPAASVQESAERWIDRFWTAYQAADIIVECQRLNGKTAFDPSQPASASMRTQDEEQLFANIVSNCGVGFCLGGYVTRDRMPNAFQCWFQPLEAKPVAQEVRNIFSFWGAPNMIKRLIFGSDDALRDGILSCGKWNGTEAELDAILQQQILAHPIVPIRDAIDFVHSCILSTIKALKFSNFSQICGGPIEIAVITADRPFRWVRHKEWDSAIAEGAQ